jgi:hypothetical protein
MYLIERVDSDEMGSLGTGRCMYVDCCSNTHHKLSDACHQVLQYLMHASHL